MSNNGDHSEPGSGLRRRSSAKEHENEQIVESANDVNLDMHETYSMPRRAVTDPIGASISSGVDSAVTHHNAHHDAPHRVRFSVDVDGREAGRGLHNGHAQLAGDSASLRPGTPELSLDTGAGKAAARADMFGRISTRGHGITSPTSPRSAPGSPASPASRNRGYSLRRSLFNRNMNGQSPDRGEVIELQEAGSSSNFAAGRQTVSTPQSQSKKSHETTITISPALDRDEEIISDRKGKGVRGIAALPHYENWVQARSRQRPVAKRIRGYYRTAQKFILRTQELPASSNGRQIDLDPSRKKALIDERTGHPYIDNTIRSSRYTAWNFVPRQLFAQFSKLANFYFLCVSILQMIPGLSTTGTYTTIVPLLFFVGVSMFKEGYDDLRRYRLDKVENNQTAKVMHAYKPTGTGAHDGFKEELAPHEIAPVHWADTKWHDVRVGDIVKLDRDDAAPADMVLLHSSGANNIAFVETMALDGETNLKSKQTPAAFTKLCRNPESLASTNAHFVVEDPNLNLYNFEGKLMVGGETSPLTNNEIVYRGSVLRNTPSAVGMVIYSGEECKIRMNANKNPRTKAPALQFLVNKIVIAIVIFVVCLAIFNTVAYQVWRANNEAKAFYLQHARVAFFPVLTSFIIMFNTMIPLSLYVSMEIIKLSQMLLLNDIDMYDTKSDTPFEARTSTINEELGQISYVFSDKTGTLTDNVMKFRKMSVAGTAWLHDADLKDDTARSKQLLHKERSKGKKPARKSAASTIQPAGKALIGSDDDADEDNNPPDYRASTGGVKRWKSTARPGKAQPEMLTQDMLRYVQRKPHTVFARKVKIFLLSIALCHTCLPETQEDGSVDFQASSPDELALVRAAQEMGFLVINRDVGTITLKHEPRGGNTDPYSETFEVLDVIEFSSKRKRMSIVTRFPDQRIALFCKGADSIIMQRLKLATIANQKVVEIEARASRRKSLEAQHAMRRKSEQVERQNSIGAGRPSLTLSGRASLTIGRGSISAGRTSLGGIPRTSTQLSKLRPIHDEVDSWLREREQDVDASALHDDSPYYTPRASTQIPRRSIGVPEPRTSTQSVDFDDELVDEALAVDDQAVIERCFQHINDFATEGLRTLLYGYRFLDGSEYAAWKKVYLDATTSLVDRQNMIERAGDLIEQDLELAGATAIEDKLQEGVPEAIDKLRRANIKMWMLTGDKRETAINIGHSCRLIKDYSSVTVLDHETGEVEQHIASAIVAINKGQIAHSVMVVDGQTLALITEDKPLQALFFDLAILVDSVICCRASPAQKASLVHMIRRRVKSSITLAIGDGANDIAMIQEAHVGIGITGKEGLQAARTSDYSIAQFRFLTKLLLVHGRWNYIRTCKYTVGTFWKEFLFYLTQALYQRWAGYTGTSLYESWSLSMFNTLFTSLPVIFMGIFEKDLAAPTLLAVPELYTKGQRNGGFNWSVYLGWMAMASAEAVVVYFCMLGLYGQALFTLDQGLFAMGDMTFTACVIIIATKMLVLEMHNKSFVAAIGFVLSVGGWFLWNILLAVTYTKNQLYNVKDGIFDRFGRNALWWLTLILIIASCIVLELGVTSLRAAFFTTDVDTFQALEKDPAIKRRFEEAAALELQQSWQASMEKSSKTIIETQRDEAEQARREGEIQTMLNNRERGMEEGKAYVVGEELPRKQSQEIDEILGRRIGDSRGEPLR